MRRPLALWRKHGQTMQRVWGEGIYGGLEMPDALDFFDAHGMPVRRTGIFDGEGAAGFYNVTENVGGKDVPRSLFDNWRAQLAAWVKGQRNHPSIFIWSMENEITFINAHVFGQDPVTTPEMKKASDRAGRPGPDPPADDRRRQCLLDESLPVYGGHYMEPPFDTLPEGAYDKAGFAHRQVWPITQAKPILFGEDFFASGVELADLATVGGESAFVGKAEVASGDRPGRQDAVRRLPLERHQLPVLVRRRDRRPLQLLAAGRRAVPPVGLDLRLRPERDAHPGHLQRHARRLPDHADLDADGRRQKSRRSDQHAQVAPGGDRSLT